MTTVVRGEASESEDEQFHSKMKGGVFASEVTGEASESDEDLYDKASSATAQSGPQSNNVYCNNLLQRKLIENNVCIWNSLNGFVKSLVVSASKQLLATDQLLIKSQVSMQTILSTLKQTHTNVQQLQDKCNVIFTTNYLPAIKLSPPDESDC